MRRKEQILAVTVGMSLTTGKNRSEEAVFNASVEDLIERFAPENPPSICAEVETLSEYLKRNSKLDTEYSIYLLYVNDPGKPGETQKAEKVAEKLRDLLLYFKETRDEFKQVSVKDIIGFRLSVFSQKEGLTSDDFFNVLLDLREKSRNESKDFAIIASGGYKIIIVYAAVFGFLFKVPVYYKFIESKNLIPLDDPLPLYWDMRELEHHVTRLRSKAGLGTLYSFLSDNIDTIREETLYSEPLLNSKMPDGELKLLLKENLPFWMNQWIGDQVPEMVEHSKRHSRRLLEKFEFLNEGGIFSPDFCENEEVFYFLLIASAYLHDIGHTMIEYKGLQLQAFPEILRKYHHILSKKFLENHRDEMGLGKLDEELFTALKLICMYHRKDMFLANPLKNVKETDRIFFRYFDEEVVPMNNHPEFKNLPEQIQRITLKVAALLKLLDEMDVQADRIVDEHYKDARNFRTELEIDHLKTTFENLKKRTLEEDSPEDIDKILKHFTLEDLKDLTNCTIFACSLKNRIKFKEVQKKHFEKHEKIRAVVPTIQDEELIIHIDVEPNSNDENIKDVEDAIKEQIKLLINDEKSLTFSLFPFHLESVKISRA